MIITISGTPGSGKSTVAKIVAERLSLKHYSVGNFRREMAEKKGMTINELNKLGETDFSTDDEADKWQIELGKKEDNFIIDGRLSFHFIPDSIKIFIDVDMKEGARRIFNDHRDSEDYKTEQDALNHLKQRLESDKKRYKKYYSLDCHDKKHYNLVIDTTNCTSCAASDYNCGQCHPLLSSRDMHLQFWSWPHQLQFSRNMLL